jgi:GNAT superfamily N-acetyltransferase
MMTDITIRPVTAQNWDDLADFFRGHGNPNYCWCMTWRVTGSEFSQLGSGGRQAALRERVMTGQPIGLLAYQAGDPVGWCSIAARESYGRLERSRTIKRLDERPTWTVVCFFLAPSVRGKRLGVALLQEGVRVAAEHGAQVVEGYPIDSVRDENGNWTSRPSYRFMGFKKIFEQAGFIDVTPPEGTRTIMRVETKG